MIVFIFRQYAVPPYLSGGTRHYEIAKAMADDGIKVYIFCSNFSHASKEYQRKIDGLYQIEHVNGVNFVWVNTSSYKKNGFARLYGMYKYSVNVYHTAIQLNIIPDVIIGSSAPLFAPFSAQKVSRRFGCKFYFDIGDLWPEALVSAGTIKKYNLLTLIFYMISFYLYRKADLILVLVADAKKKIESKKISSKKIIIFPPGKSTIPTLTSNNKHTIANDIEKLIITYTGSLNPIYPLDELINAIGMLQNHGEQFKKIELFIYGAGENKSELIEKVNSMSLRSRIHFPDPVPKDRVQELLAKSDILIAIEKKILYGFPNKLIDYLFAGKPIILASEADYQLDTQCVLQCNPKAQGICQKIKQLATISQNERMLLGKDGVNYALSYFDMKKNYQNILRPHLNRI
ncbi:MAG: glycosyltransferase WbuB [Candidatus Electrothrix sp. LOE1_4_5]|nr:glycosyltransferase WbuB [Candidatus Electrothrix gigas]